MSFMDAGEASPLQSLILRRLVEQADDTGRPMSTRAAAEQSGGRMPPEDLRAFARGERGEE